MNISIQPTQLVFRSNVKGLYKQGKLPSVTTGLYGDQLTKENVTDEHVVPKSKGGTKKDGNTALATAQSNFERGNKSLSEVLTEEAAEAYLKQFEGVKIPEDGFDGDAYIRSLWASIKRAMKMK